MSAKREGRADWFREPAPLELLGTQSEPGTVLVADDEAVVRTVISSMLRRMGYTVVLAGDGAEALRIYAGRYHEIGAVIFDLMLPDMTGEQLYGQLRRVNPGLRAMLVTGASQSEMLPQLRFDGVSRILPKPFDYADLREALTETLAA